MSFSESLLSVINDVVETYIDRLVSKYDLNKQELQNIWEGKDRSAPPAKKKTDNNSVTGIDTEDVSEARLMKCTNAELRALCEAKGHKKSGKKSVLIARLLGNDEGPAKPERSAEAKTAPAKKPRARKAGPSEVIKKLTAQVQSISIMRNRFNNHEHADTGFVFDRKSKKVIGKQNDNGDIDDLTPDDIDMCKKYKFEYTIPENLNQGSLGEVQVEGVDEESEEEIGLEEESESDVEVVLGGDDDEDDASAEVEEYYEEDGASAD